MRTTRKRGDLPVTIPPARLGRGLRLAAGAAALLVACEESGPSNVAPTATFTAQCTALGCSFTNGSSDPDGTLEAYAWDFGDESAGSTTRDAAHTYAAAGRFRVTLTVTDDDGDSTAATATVDVKAPTKPGGGGGGEGGLTASFTVSCVELLCVFTDRSAASVAATYTWTFGDGSGPALTRDASHTYAAEGLYAVTLTVADGGQTGRSSRMVTVERANISPNADFVYGCTDLACEFTDRSADVDGSIASYSWDFGDGLTSTERNPAHVFAAAGTYTVALTVTDARGAGATATRRFSLPATDWPAAELIISCYYSSCGFYTESTGAIIVAWQWSFGDGGTSIAQYPNYNYAAPGTYMVQVTITDLQGGTATISQEVTVPVLPPTPDFTADCTGTTCTFTNQTSPWFFAGAYWDFGDGSVSGDWSPFHTYQVTEPTTFTVSLSVYDWDFGGATISKDITVSP